MSLNICCGQLLVPQEFRVGIAVSINLSEGSKARSRRLNLSEEDQVFQVTDEVFSDQRLLKKLG